ncbi:hypothetical protein IK7_06255 [Bacillus cereus VD156]|uniref:Uncharacterized protein n=1 Tax=Bacillus cereus (strain VD014) TaxID=1053223 RepID=A0A9W5KBD1_BACC8|nr:hypothetical protein IIA_00949 [Bacillus cereus VD014]EJR71483.1 hypothetical protein IK7_06255 [Bacillus cereus VD156]
MKAQIEIVVLFCLFKKNYYSYLCIFMVIHKLYNQPDEKDMMCNMIHKTVTKCVEKYIVSIPFILYIFKKHMHIGEIIG